MTGKDSGCAAGTKGSPQTSIMSFETARLLHFYEEMFAGRMPYASAAVTPKEKFLKYSLDPTNPRSRGKPEAYQRGLGYTRENAAGLIAQIHHAVTSGDVRPFELERSQHGAKFKYRIPVTGPNGKTKDVIAVYQIDNGSQKPRMITNYLEKKRKK